MTKDKGETTAEIVKVVATAENVVSRYEYYLTDPTGKTHIARGIAEYDGILADLLQRFPLAPIIIRAELAGTANDAAQPVRK